MNLLAEIPAALPKELTQTLLAAPAFRLERIVSQGHRSDDGFWYDQADHEWVLLVQGAARLRFENSVSQLQPGDYLNIPAHTRHRVEWTDPNQTTVWLAIHYSGHSP